MPRVSASLAYQRRCQVHELAASGLSLRKIATQLGLPLASVQNYLASEPGTDPALALTAAVEVKRSNPHYGPMQVRDILEASGVEVLPSESTLGALFQREQLTNAAVYRKSRMPYWTHLRYTQPLECIQLDTVKLRLRDGALVTLLSARDVVTGATFLQRYEGTQVGMVRSMARIFAIFGVPQVVQADNGTTDFSMVRRDLLRPWHRVAFSLGVQRIVFIPEAEPYRNGSVESFHNWLQRENTHTGVESESLFDSWLAAKLHYYNYVKSLSSVGGKSFRRAPADLHPGFNLSAAPLSTDLPAPTSGTISFIRRGLHARCAVVKSPALVFAIPPSLEGHYLRFDLHLGGSGEVWTRDASVASSAPESRVRGRFVDRSEQNPGLLVGTFSHHIGDVQCGSGIIFPDYNVSVADFAAVRMDDAQLARHWAKILKQSVPDVYGAHLCLVPRLDRGPGCWDMISSATGEVIWSEQGSPTVLEHASEEV